MKNAPPKGRALEEPEGRKDGGGSRCRKRQIHTTGREYMEALSRKIKGALAVTEPAVTRKCDRRTALVLSDPA